MSRRKGAVGEREIVRLLGPWWASLEPESRFIRTADGGRGPIDRRLHGDIAALKAPRWPFVVEVKRVEDFNLQRWLNCGSSPVWGFWKQVVDEARFAERRPMLWFRKNRDVWRVLVEADLFHATSLDHPASTEACFGERFTSTMGLPATVAFKNWQLLALSPGIFAREV